MYRYNGFTSRFVGAYNFIRIFLREPDYWFAVLNTFILAIGKLIVELSLALVLAYILDKQIKFRVFFRAVFFLPTIISVAIIGIIFFFIFATYNGILNSLLMSVHIISEPINWFASKWKAMFILATASIWQNFGLNMVFFLTGLQSIPKEIYESAEMDGASEPQKFFRITIPMLGPVLQIIIMLALLGSLKITDLVLVLTGGGPAGKTNVMMTFVYDHFFGAAMGTSVDYGYSSALAVVSSIIIGIVTIIYLRFSKKSSTIY